LFRPRSCPGGKDNPCGAPLALSTGPAARAAAPAPVHLRRDLDQRRRRPPVEGRDRDAAALGVPLEAALSPGLGTVVARRRLVY
jgi:hypothetical protein